MHSLSEDPRRRSVPAVKNQEIEQLMKQMNEKTWKMFQCIEEEEESMQQKRSDAGSNPLRRQSTLDKAHAQGLKKSVKYNAAALLLAEPFGLAQEFMDKKLELRKNKEGQEWLLMNFGDCKNLARISALLTKIQTLDPEDFKDKRFDRCRATCVQVQQVLEDQENGLGDKFRQKLEEERKKVEEFLQKNGVDPDTAAEAAAAAKAVADKEAAEAADAAKAKADAEAAEAEAAAAAKAVADKEAAEAAEAAKAKADAEAAEKKRAEAPKGGYGTADPGQDGRGEPEEPPKALDLRWSTKYSHALRPGKHDLERNGNLRGVRTIDFDRVSMAVKALQEGASTIPEDVYKEGYCIVVRKENKQHYLIFRSDVLKVVEEKFDFEPGAQFRSALSTEL